MSDIAPDSTVTVLSAHMDGGQGIYTGLATLVAEELDADWSQMRAEGAWRQPQALRQSRLGRRHPGYRRLVEHPGLLGALPQGRRDRARHAGRGRGPGLGRAGGRDPGRERHRQPPGSGKSGELRRAGRQRPRPCLPPADVTLKDPAAWRLHRQRRSCGGSTRSTRPTGAQQFPIDVRPARHADRGPRPPAALRRQGAARSTPRRPSR